MSKKMVFYIYSFFDLIERGDSSDRLSNDANMFINDMSNYICPYSNDSVYGFSSLKLMGCDSHLAQAKKLILSLSRRTHDSSDRYIEEAIRHVASIMLQNRGHAYFAFNLEDKPSIWNVRGRVVLDVFNIIILTLPKSFGLDRNKRGINVKYENIVKFSISSEYSKKNDISKIIAGLMLSREFPYQNINIQSGNFLIYSNVKNKSVLSLTKSWGWDMRRLSNDKLTVTYVLYRRINLIISLIKIRKAVVENFNKLFEIAGLSINIKMQERFELSYLEELKLKVRAGGMLDSELKEIVGPV